MSVRGSEKPQAWGRELEKKSKEGRKDLFGKMYENVTEMFEYKLNFLSMFYESSKSSVTELQNFQLKILN